MSVIEVFVFVKIRESGTFGILQGRTDMINPKRCVIIKICVEKGGDNHQKI
jgi:hypothetical protein